jgi:hypothetical protein
MAFRLMRAGPQSPDDCPACNVGSRRDHEVAHTIVESADVWLRRARYSVRTHISGSPALYLPLVRLRYRGVTDRVVGPDTDLVIEGFQRSGNTFAVIAFEVSQPRPYATAHHLHAAAQIIASARHGVPCLLLVRDPIETVVSQLQREPRVTPRQALTNWSLFHERVLPYRDDFVIGDFHDVTTDYGRVIKAVNHRFETEFAPFEHTEANVEKVFGLIDEQNRARFGRIAEDKVPRPSAEREAKRDQVRREVESPRTSALRKRAYEAYAALIPESH